MLSTPLSPEKDAEIKDLAQAICEAVDAEINELAANLASTDGSPFSFGVCPSVRRPKVLVFSGCKSHLATGSLQPVAIGAAVEVTRASEPSRQLYHFGGAEPPGAARVLGPSPVSGAFSGVRGLLRCQSIFSRRLMRL